MARFVKGFSPYPPQAYWDRAWLEREYAEKGKPLHVIAAELGVTTSPVHHWLKKHGIKARTNGEIRALEAAPRKRPPGPPLAERFWAKVEKKPGCWIWKGSVTKHGGYGELIRGGGDRTKLRAHRVSWELHHGPIPDGLCIFLRCGNPLCVRPEHLRIARLRDRPNYNSEPVPIRFWRNVKNVGGEGCWEWTGTKTTGGYGVLSVDRRPEKAHRIAWRLTHGEPAPHFFVCHRCDNPPCVRPDHLFLGTHQDNMGDMVRKGRHYRRGPVPDPTRPGSRYRDEPGE